MSVIASDAVGLKHECESDGHEGEDGDEEGKSERHGLAEVGHDSHGGRGAARREEDAGHAPDVGA